MNSIAVIDLERKSSELYVAKVGERTIKFVKKNDFFVPEFSKENNDSLTDSLLALYDVHEVLHFRTALEMVRQVNEILDGVNVKKDLINAFHFTIIQAIGHLEQVIQDEIERGNLKEDDENNLFEFQIVIATLGKMVRYEIHTFFAHFMRMKGFIEVESAEENIKQVFERAHG